MMYLIPKNVFFSMGGGATAKSQCGLNSLDVHDGGRVTITNKCMDGGGMASSSPGRKLPCDKEVGDDSSKMEPGPGPRTSTPIPRSDLTAGWEESQLNLEDPALSTRATTGNQSSFEHIDPPNPTSAASFGVQTDEPIVASRAIQTDQPAAVTSFGVQTEQPGVESFGAQTDFPPPPRPHMKTMWTQVTPTPKKLRTQGTETDEPYPAPPPPRPRMRTMATQVTATPIP